VTAPADEQQADPSAAVPSRLARRLGTFDAVVIGLGAMIGAGVFAAFGPAAKAAGNGLLVGLALAALVAYCNATSSAQLAAIYPESGGTYVYGRKRLGSFWGFLAGWGFVIGKLASCAAMAMTFATYAAPSLARPLAVGAVVALTAVNYLGVKRTAHLTRVIVACVLAALAVVVGSVWLGGGADPAHLTSLSGTSAYGILQSAGLLFFAFAGYARLATLGEEVIDPQRTIPRAIPIALGITLAVYAAVAVSALAGAGAEGIATSAAPLATAVEQGDLAWLSPVVRVGAAIASLGVLLSLIVGVSRTAFAMSANRDLPGFLAAVHPRFRVPHRAELAVGVVVAAVAATADIRSAIGFSSFAVLIYYALANASAWTLDRSERRWPRYLAALGVLGCVSLALTLPLYSVLAGAAVLLLGCIVYAVRRGRPRGEWRRVRAPGGDG
jgi:APA family basic amino acid/polyamine antiporter